jgi:hypothetical protein
VPAVATGYAPINLGVGNEKDKIDPPDLLRIDSSYIVEGDAP